MGRCESGSTGRTIPQLQQSSFVQWFRAPSPLTDQQAAACACTCKHAIVQYSYLPPGDHHIHFQHLRGNFVIPVFRAAIGGATLRKGGGTGRNGREGGVRNGREGGREGKREREREREKESVTSL